MRTLFLILYLALSAQATTYYVSTSGSGSSCSVGTPCSLQSGFNKGLTGDDVLLIHGGTYTGKFTSSLTGTSGHPITVKSYCTTMVGGCVANPSEWAKIDGYLTSTLAVALPNSGGDPVTVVFTSNPGFNEGTAVWIGTELIRIAAQQGDGVTWTNCTRGYGATPVSAHSIGDVAHDDSDVLIIAGAYTNYRDFELFNSGLVRALNSADENIIVATRGEGVVVHPSTSIKLINLVIHDNREGILAAVDAADLEVYGCLIYNNGLVDQNRGHGEGLYLLNQTPSVKQVRNIISWNGFGDGMKGYSESQFADNITWEHIISFNNGVNSSYAGNPAGGSTDLRLLNIYGGTGNSSNPINNIKVHGAYLFHPTNAKGGNLSLGYQAPGATGLEVLDSRIEGGNNPLTLNHFSTGYDVERNVIYGQTETLGVVFNTLVDMNVETSHSGTFNNNTYYEDIPLSAGAHELYRFAINGSYTLSCVGGSLLKYACTPVSGNGGWQENSGFDAGSTLNLAAPSSNEVFLIPNEFDSNRWHLAIYDWTAASSVNVTITGQMNNGDTWAFYPAEAATFPTGTAFQTGTVSGSTISITTSGWSVAPAIGNASMGNFVPATMAPTFVGGILLRTATASTGGSTTSGSVAFTGKVILAYCATAGFAILMLTLSVGMALRSRHSVLPRKMSEQLWMKAPQHSITEGQADYLPPQMHRESVVSPAAPRHQ